jgi:hypothetical protein
MDRILAMRTRMFVVTIVLGVTRGALGQADAPPVPFSIFREVEGAAIAEDYYAESESAGVVETSLQPSYGMAAPAVAPLPARKPVPNPYKGLFYDNDFKYLENPHNTEPDRLGDRLKRNPLGPWITWDIGGEYRLRQHSENNIRSPALIGLDDDFLLHRTRIYLNLEIGENYRLFAEAIDAVSNYERFAPRTIEENRFDALNLFFDARLSQAFGGDLWARVGRQELLYGAQRLISPLDWANTRRTFDGAKLFWRGEDWNVDGFWTRPVPFGQHVNQDSNFDNNDHGQEFMGLYSTYKGEPDHTFDFYFLRLAQYNGGPSPPNFAGLPAGASADANLLGARWLGKHDRWLWEAEGGYQFGEFGALTQSAGYFTLGGGYDFADCPWKPVLWAYYDWASGDNDPADGRRGTFNQYFPLGHKYFGFMDLIARQNIQDYNAFVTLKPSDQTQLLIWYHVFQLQNPNDALYGVAGAPVRGPNPAAGADVGQELDLLFTWFITQRTDIVFGYSHFFAGSYIERSAVGAQIGSDADFFYTQFSQKF